MLDIINEPNSILHRKVGRVLKIDEGTVELVSQMRNAMHKANGIGQVGS